ncbi:MAG: hypothetical protein LBQ31_01370, partial [Bacteroidales bacterium]|nr:hypothetical protein [Bacteroidales bacterium]
MGVPLRTARECLSAGSGYPLQSFARLFAKQTPHPKPTTPPTTTDSPQALAGKRISATKSRVSEGRGRACADYAERERLHCEAIIPHAPNAISNHKLSTTNYDLCPLFPPPPHAHPRPPHRTPPAPQLPPTPAQPAPPHTPAHPPTPQRLIQSQIINHELRPVFALS